MWIPNQRVVKVEKLATGGMSRVWTWVACLAFYLRVWLHNRKHVSGISIPGSMAERATWCGSKDWKWAWQNEMKENKIIKKEIVKTKQWNSFKVSTGLYLEEKQINQPYKYTRFLFVLFGSFLYHWYLE